MEIGSCCFYKGLLSCVPYDFHTVTSSYSFLWFCIRLHETNTKCSVKTSHRLSLASCMSPVAVPGRDNFGSCVRKFALLSKKQQTTVRFSLFPFGR